MQIPHMGNAAIAVAKCLGTPALVSAVGLDNELLDGATRQSEGYRLSVLAIYMLTESTAIAAKRETRGALYAGSHLEGITWCIRQGVGVLLNSFHREKN